MLLFESKKEHVSHITDPLVLRSIVLQLLACDTSPDQYIREVQCVIDGNGATSALKRDRKPGAWRAYATFREFTFAISLSSYPGVRFELDQKSWLEREKEDGEKWTTDRKSVV